MNNTATATTPSTTTTATTVSIDMSKASNEAVEIITALELLSTMAMKNKSLAAMREEVISGITAHDTLEQLVIINKFDELAGTITEAEEEAVRIDPAQEELDRLKREAIITAMSERFILFPEIQEAPIDEPKSVHVKDGSWLIPDQGIILTRQEVYEVFSTQTGPKSPLSFMVGGW